MIEICFDDSWLNDIGWTFDPVIHFSCGFSVGDISEDIPGPARYAVVCRLLRQPSRAGRMAKLPAFLLRAAGQKGKRP